MWYLFAYLPIGEGVTHFLTRSSLRKTLKSRNHSRDHILVQYLLNLLRMFTYIKAWKRLILFHVGSKSKSIKEILEKRCEHHSGHY